MAIVGTCSALTTTISLLRSREEQYIVITGHLMFTRLDRALKGELGIFGFEGLFCGTGEDVMNIDWLVIIRIHLCCAQGREILVFG